MPIEAPKKKRSLLPTLTVLFCFSYVLMTLLIIQQGSVIQSQGNLIKVLMRDSKELWAAKGKAIEDQQMSLAQSKNRAHAPASKTPSSQMPSTQTPSTQVPSVQDPSTQVPQSHTQNHGGKIAKPQPQAPPVPASDLVDQRRSLTTI
jgi:DNA replication initiation complex subunit (GINS family)